LKLDITCLSLGSSTACEKDPIFQAEPKTIAQWAADGGQLIRYLHSSFASSGPDRLDFYAFNYEMTGKFPISSDSVATFPGSSYRCDAASRPSIGRRGCRFQDVDETFARLAAHIFDVFFRPEVTVPRPPEVALCSQFPRIAQPQRRLFTSDLLDQN